MPVEGLTGKEIDVLMGLQYLWPRDPYPYRAIAAELGMDEDELLETARSLARRGIIKRVGFYVNYRSQGLRAALIAYSAGDRIEEIAGLYRRDPLATHVYQRDHPVYDLWVVTKRNSMEELVEHARQVSEEYNVDYVVLYSKRTFKLSVKFDLDIGISRAGQYSMVSNNPPRPEELGATRAFLNRLRALPIDRDPYRAAAETLGISSVEAANLAWRLLDAGVLGDPGAALDGRRVGFAENGMVVMEPSGCEEELCECVSRLPFTTHVVQRGSIPEGKWRHTCYFMVHAVERSIIDEAVEVAVERCGPKSYHVIRSIADLKPGVRR